MDNYKNYIDNHKIIAEFVVAYCKNGKIVQKLSRDPKKREQQKAEVNAFKYQNEALGLDVVEEYMCLSNMNYLPAFMSFYWNKLSSEEKELAIKIALKENSGLEFDETKSFPPDQNNEIYPFYIEGDKLYLNSDLFKKENRIPPIHILGMIYAIPFEKRKAHYLSSPMPKNIFGFEDFEHLGCVYHFSDINCEEDEKTFMKKMECVGLDSVTNRAYRVAQYEALTAVLEEIHHLSYIPAADTKFMDDEIECLMEIESNIDETLESGPEDRDMDFIAKCNESLNQKAIAEGRLEDVVDEADALEHFGYYFEVDHVVDGTEEEIDESDEEQERQYDA